MKFQEASLENLVIENLRDINYEYIHGSNLERAKAKAGAAHWTV